jgi:hypothetical protein
MQRRRPRVEPPTGPAVVSMTTTSIHKKTLRPARPPRNAQLRLALRLQSLLCLPPARPGPLDAISDALRQVRDDARALEGIWRRAIKATDRGWPAAATAVLQEIPATARRLYDRAAALARLPVPTADYGRQIIPLPDLLAELRALRAEFGELQIDSHLSVLSVETDPIELEGVYLGPFRIELQLALLRAGRVDASAFRCVATDPNPAAANESTTHLHVRDHEPCLGDATVPVRAAIRSGRVTDAFLSIAAVLQTYNPHSPYVALADWSGRSCSDCGRGRAEDDLYHCGGCGEDFCDGCSSSCDACDSSFCMGCLERGKDRDQYLCPDCRGSCRQCEAITAAAQLDEHDGLCPACAADSSDDDNDVEEQELEESPVHPSLETDHEPAFCPTAPTIPQVDATPAATIAP